MTTEHIQIRTDNYFAAFPHWVLDKKLSSSAIHLYLALLSFANWETKMGKPSRQTLADLMNCSIKTVDRAKDELVTNGLLRYTRRPNNSNYYTVITANPHSDKNDTSEVGSDKNDISRGDKNDTLTRINNYIKDAEPKGSARNQSPIQKLTAAYIENLPEWAIKPSWDQICGQMSAYLKNNDFDELMADVVELGKEGKALSVYDLQRIRRARLDIKPAQPATPIPERYVPEVKSDAVPMPAYVKDLLRNGFQKP